MNHEADCRTAPATLGLLIKAMDIIMLIAMMNFKKCNDHFDDNDDNDDGDKC